MFLKVDNLYFKRAESAVINNLSLALNPGKLIILQGSNGSGKTTLLKLIAGILLPDAGNITLTANSLYLGHNNYLQPNLSIKVNLNFLLSCINESKVKVDPIYKELDFNQPEKLAKELSAGNQQRLKLALLLASNANLWLLDEPMNNLDLKWQHWLLEKIKAHLAANGAAIISMHQAQDWLNLPHQLVDLSYSHRK